MADIIYTYRNKVYLNLTNRCPCSCTFCIRSNADGLGSANTLWHKSDPTAEEITAAIESFDFSGFPEVTFCGYGEPTERLPELLQRIVGSPDQLAEWERVDDDKIDTVIQSNFMRSFRARAANEREYLALPTDIRRAM